jgi:hypothetical protein
LLRNRLSQEALFPAESGMDVVMTDETNAARRMIVRIILLYLYCYFTNKSCEAGEGLCRRAAAGARALSDA